MNSIYVDKVYEERGNAQTELQYYIIEERLNEYCPEPMRYGAEIRMKYRCEDRNIIEEKKRIRSIFFRKSNAYNFINILMQNRVKPAELRDKTEEHFVGQAAHSGGID